MKDNIHEKINKLENLKDRALLKELLSEVFIPLYEHSENMYTSLEDRVFEEIEYTQQNYSVYTSIVKKQDFDPIHYFLAPMIKEDIQDKEYDLKYILETMIENKQVNMFKVFFKCDYLIFKDILKDNVVFKGNIKTNKNDYEACFKIKTNTEYKNQIYKLYQMFIRNNIPWTTINAPYISRIVDVVLVEYEEGITKDEMIQEVNVDFGEFGKYIEYDMVPIWNIQERTLKSTGFPMPCEDKINFEHIISLKSEGVEHGYLVVYDNEDINHIRHTKDSLMITGEIEEARDWDIFKILKIRESKLDKYSYELVSNSKKVSFIEKLSSKNKVNIKTKAELIRTINSFEVSKYLEFKDVKIVDIKDDLKEETYDMNSFIIDEIRDQDYAKRLILYFTLKENNCFIIRDLLSFIVSQIQLNYPEYKCEGRLI
ncbi:normocyte-binding protein [Tepidibacter mesophilus]|uniref:normocyte-binding protein n=1 Tax=Tepidibacter mesophilus TaxID=655607 RepID=UPI000C086B98|nr:normocyte-binding protein [Tepidibacter mesophilus]